MTIAMRKRPFLVFIVNAEVAAFHEVQRAVVGALVDEQLPWGQMAGLEIGGRAPIAQA